MDDYGDDIRKEKSLSPKMRALMRNEKREARKRIIDRGIVHFRADTVFMEALLSAAESQKIAPGTLCRHIVWEYLQSKQATWDRENNSAFADLTSRFAAPDGQSQRAVHETARSYRVVATESKDERTIGLDEIRSIIKCEVQAVVQEYALEAKQEPQKSGRKKKSK